MSRLKMNAMRALAAALLMLGSLPGVALAQPAGIKRTDLQRHDLSVPGREAVQVRVDIDPGVAFGRHTHPGEEIIYVLAGSLEYQIEGKPPVTLDVLVIAVHDFTQDGARPWHVESVHYAAHTLP